MVSREFRTWVVAVAFVIVVVIVSGSLLVFSPAASAQGYQAGPGATQKSEGLSGFPDGLRTIGRMSGLERSLQFHGPTLQVGDLTPPQLEITPISAAVVRPFFWDSASARIPLNMRETTGVTETITYPPTLQSLLQSQSGTTGGAPGGTGVEHTWKLINADGSVATENTITVAPNQPLQMALLIENVRDPGQHQGTVRWTAPNAPKAENAFTLSVKDDWIVPFVVLLLGVFLSYFSRYWIMIGRPRALEERKIVIALNTIRTELDPRNPDDDFVRRLFEAQLADLRESNELAANVNVDTELAKASLELNNYFGVRSVLQLSNRLDQLLPDQNRRDNYRSELQDLRQQLYARGLDGLAADFTSPYSLLAIATSIRTSLEQEVLTRIKTEAADLLTQLTSLGQQIQNSNLAGMDDLTRRVSTLQSEATDLQMRLSAPSINPVPTPTITMNSQIAEYNGLLDKYQILYRDFLLRAFDDLEARAGKTADELKAGGSPAQGPLKEAESIARGAAGAQAQLKATVPLKADDLQEANRVYAALDTRLQNMAVGKGLGDLAKPIAAVVSIVTNRIPGLPTTQRINWPDLKGLRRSILVNDSLILLISLVVSSLAGMTAVWAANPGFGTWIDYATIFLWGFGVSKLSDIAASSFSPYPQYKFNLPGAAPGA